MQGISQRGNYLETGILDRKTEKKAKKHQTPYDLKLHEEFLLNICEFMGHKYARGGHQPGTSQQGAPRPRPDGLWGPGWPPEAPLLLYGVFYPRKNHKQPFGTKRRRVEAETWVEALLHSGSQILPGKFLSGRGRLKPSSSPTFPPSWEDKSSSTSSPAPSHLQP